MIEFPHCFGIGSGQESLTLFTAARLVLWFSIESSRIARCSFRVCFEMLRELASMGNAIAGVDAIATRL
ncbi:hypothetical protein [Allofranklinella schreckenbergeri]|uniref:hypothetical protein n=1 Tax=Allofranklinella schreckenbergeri TaxID=1076744 RepID=UPI0011C49B85|nr:hypothetical protein [Allofranklinella schreckenbergeri]